MSKIEEIKDEIFGERCLQLLDLKAENRKIDIEIRKGSNYEGISKDSLNKKLKEKEEIEKKIKALPPSELVKEFIDKVICSNHTSLILTVLA